MGPLAAFAVLFYTSLLGLDCGGIAAQPPWKEPDAMRHRLDELETKAQMAVDDAFKASGLVLSA